MFSSFLRYIVLIPGSKGQIWNPMINARTLATVVRSLESMIPCFLLKKKIIPAAEC